MNRDFNKRFKKAQDDFDRDFNRLKIAIFVGWIIGLAFTLGIIGFIIWAIIIVMQYFSVI